MARLDAINVRYGADGWGVATVESAPSTAGAHQTEPCSGCPWRRDAPTGFFPPEVFRLSATTAYDLAEPMFGCHMSPQHEARTCAGFLLRGADHNLTVRMHGHRYVDVHSNVDLYDSYQEMAVANGVDPDDPALIPCRGPQTSQEAG